MGAKGWRRLSVRALLCGVDEVAAAAAAAQQHMGPMEGEGAVCVCVLGAARLGSIDRDGRWGTHTKSNTRQGPCHHHSARQSSAAVCVCADLEISRAHFCGL